MRGNFTIHTARTGLVEHHIAATACVKAAPVAHQNNTALVNLSLVAYATIKSCTATGHTLPRWQCISRWHRISTKRTYTACQQ
jgi:hypothetical protein